MDRASRSGVSAVVVDWADVPFLTLAGVAVLEDFREGALERGVQVRLVASHRVPRGVLRIVGLDYVLAIHDTVEQALAGGKASGEGRGRPEIGKTS
ncbi:STAS domain-containing protein [Streptomyces sp. NPDC058268]|uniref:STAS domain-containing protein n=1 Tax=Streptomyces sp. NPDC058268 TaxID=3346413 RepID=UPI0036E15C81